MGSVKISSGGFRMAFLAVGVAVLWSPTRWMVDNLRSLHARRGVTPELLSGPAGPGIFLSAPAVTEIRAASAGTKPIVFRLLAPAAKSVFLGGSFNEFNASRHPLVRGAGGLWETTVPLAPGQHIYKFKVDGEWVLDPASPDRTPAPRECSTIDVKP
ncbi:MAG: glycogen-binding domain-containing protein [Elusimicrobia bacterium]|nr:glycogen-binding domain-containing protein [Elusimicrobiota bacterium]MBP9127339.1 glycogen-binding domain-containing protein [Elusimicrobiota bacterium]